MNKHLTTFLTLGTALLLSINVWAAGDETYTIDASHSTVIFRVSHFNVGAVYGRFREVKGEFTIGKKAKANSVKVEIAADKIYTGDRKRDEHLKGPDFLNVKQFPKITFESTKVRKAGKSYVVAGNLTLHGVTKAVKVRMKHLGSGEDGFKKYRAGFEGTLSIKRSDFGIKKMPGAVGEKIQLTIAIEGIRK